MLLEGLRLIEDVVMAIGPWASLLVISLLVLIMFGVKIKSNKHNHKDW